MSRRVLIYKRFERFWHWAQAALIVALGVTGFEIHGTFTLLGFEAAVSLHNLLAWALITLIVFAVFWHFTTGEWRQYLPTRRNLGAMARYYLRGIFRGEPHPVKKTELSKLNPLQRLTYLGLKLVVIPLQVISGLLYHFYDDLGDRGFLAGGVGPVAVVHIVGSFALVVFLVVHVYLTTTGHTPTSNIKAMITGWEQLEEDPTDQQGKETA
jgi:thiosulfate reductase cytochrome b subunit